MSLLREAELAASTRAEVGDLLPCREDVGWRCPADSWIPGATPAQAASWPAVGKRVMSVPVSTTITCAVMGPTPGDGLEQLQLVGPGLVGVVDDLVQDGQGGVDGVQPAQGRLPESGVVGVEAAGEGLDEVGIFARILPLASWARTWGSASPAMRAASIRRTETVVTDEATAETLIEASSSICSSRSASRLRSPVSWSTRYRVSGRSRRIGGGGTNEGPPRVRARGASRSTSRHGRQSCGPGGP